MPAKYYKVNLCPKERAELQSQPLANVYFKMS